MDSAKYVEASIKAAMGDREAAIMVQAADDSTSNNTGLTLPTSLGGFVVNTFASRPTIDAVGGASALPASGMSFTIPRLTVAPTVADTNEGAPPSETGMESNYITVDVNKFSGINRVSFELLERSAPDFGTLLLREMQKAYAKATDTAVIAALVSGGTAAATTAGTVAGLQSFMATEGPAAYVATGGDYATELVASGAWWSALLSANDDSERPLFSALQPSNAAGVSSIGAANGNVFGANFRVDHNISTSGLVDNSAFLIAPDAVQVWESPTTQLRVNVLASGEVEIGLHGYLAVSVLKAGGVRRFNLT
jgi:HK97 family phage major capsid protein